METLNVSQMLQQLKKVYVERVVRSGFEDNCLYNDNLYTLDELELKEFEKLRNIIGSTKAIKTPDNVDINNQGLTKEEYEESELLAKKKKKERTDEEQARLEELRKKKKERLNAISILRSISIRMPLLIYGAELENKDDEITIDNFSSHIDSQSWEEFMPKDVTKEYFDTFKKYYDSEIFTAAGKRIRDMTEAADRLTIENRIARITAIFSTFRNPDKETVLTPWRVVNLHMGETLGGYNFFDSKYESELEAPRFIDKGNTTKEVFATDSKLLEINSKSGLYPLYLTYNIYRARLNDYPSPPATLEEQQAIWANVVAKNIYIICKTPMAKAITRRTLLGFRDGRINAHYFENLIDHIRNKPSAFIDRVTRGRSFWKANPDNHMKFNAVVGNPPYQEEGNSSRKSPIYHLFYDIAFKLSSKATLITPGRFLFRAGQTPKAWTNDILSDPHFKVIKFFHESTDIFPNVDIKGGVVISYRDSECYFGKIQFFSEYPQLATILKKVENGANLKKTSFASVVAPQGAYRFTELFFQSCPRALSVQGKGTAYKVTSNSLEKLTEAFLEFPPANRENYIQIMGRSQGSRVVRWIKKAYVQADNSLIYYKVFIAEANGTGRLGEVLSSPIIGTPMVGSTDTFLSVGCFQTRAEAENCRKYICTKFARTLLGTLKATQHNPRDTWSNVPLQDFTRKSDIDWGCSIAEIDSQLYRKYGLNEDEIVFIESNVKAMTLKTQTK